jgi:hypothetical protein
MTHDVMVGIVVELADKYLPIPAGYLRTWTLGWKRKGEQSEWMPVLSCTELQPRLDNIDPWDAHFDYNGMPVKKAPGFTLAPGW